MVKDITGIMKNTGSHLVKDIISSGSIVLGIKVEGKAGLLAKNVKFSDKLQKELSKKAGVGGFISTDELPRYGISGDEKTAIEKTFSCTRKDVVVFVVAEKSKAEAAIETVSSVMQDKKKLKPTKSKKIKKAKKAKKQKKAKTKLL